MARDETLKDSIESTLYSIGGISNTGEIAGVIWEGISEAQGDFVAEEVVLREEIKRLKAEVSTTDRLRKAANRCDGYMMQYGVEIEWSLSQIGLKLIARHGAETVTKYVDYNEICETFDPLEAAELSALKGLSS